MVIYDEQGQRLFEAAYVRSRIAEVSGHPISKAQWLHWTNGGNDLNVPSGMHLITIGSVGREPLYTESEVQRFLEVLRNYLRGEAGKSKQRKKQNRIRHLAQVDKIGSGTAHLDR